MIVGILRILTFCGGVLWWNCMRNWGVPYSVVELLLRGIALLSCQCNAVLSGALVPYLVHCFVVMKPVTPLQPSVSAGLKLGTPLLAEIKGFPCVVGSQWCWRFHWSARGGEHWCRRFHVDNVSAS